jgi:Zn-dependent M28 family amino/carboxypeptidase
MFTYNINMSKPKNLFSMPLLIAFSVIILVLVAALFFITSPSFASYDAQKAAKIPANKKNLYNHVNFLTSITPARNHANLAELTQAADYIHDEFAKLKGKPERQKYKADNGNKYENIIWSYNTDKTERVIIGGHYDVCGDQKGADDNASAVAGLLELARLVDSLQPNLPYRVDFVSYCLEEPPNFRTTNMGSYVHAKSLIDKEIVVKSMICLEMIGYFSSQPNSQDYPVGAMKLVYPTKGNFIAVVGNMTSRGLVGDIKSEMITYSNLPVAAIAAPAKIQGIDFSDHQNYWKFGIPAVMITDTAFFRNGNYHRETDTIETLDFDSMTEVVRGVYGAMTNL